MYFSRPAFIECSFWPDWWHFIFLFQWSMCSIFYSCILESQNVIVAPIFLKKKKKTGGGWHPIGNVCVNMNYFGQSSSRPDAGNANFILHQVSTLWGNDVSILQRSKEKLNSLWGIQMQVKPKFLDSWSWLLIARNILMILFFLPCRTK